MVSPYSESSTTGCKWIEPFVFLFVDWVISVVRPCRSFHRLPLQCYSATVRNLIDQKVKSELYIYIFIYKYIDIKIFFASGIALNRTVALQRCSAGRVKLSSRPFYDYLIFWLSDNWYIFRIFAKSFVHPISFVFSPFLARGSGKVRSLCPRLGKRTYDEGTTNLRRRWKGIRVWGRQKSHVFIKTTRIWQKINIFQRFASTDAASWHSSTTGALSPTAAPENGWWRSSHTTPNWWRDCFSWGSKNTARPSPAPRCRPFSRPSASPDARRCAPYRNDARLIGHLWADARFVCENGCIFASS